MLLIVFPVLAVLAAATGWWFQAPLSELQPAIVPLLMVIMLCMGLTLKPNDFFQVGRYGKALASGMLLQFTVMPLSALLIAKSLGFDEDLTLGMLLVGTVAGGTSSNVMTYLARGHVALSVTMTSISTTLSILLTPLLLSVLIGSKIDIPAMAMLESLVKIILLPVSLGVLINHFAQSRVHRIRPQLPVISVLCIVIIIATVVALNHEFLKVSAWKVGVATLAHNMVGMSMGFLAARLLGFDQAIQRTMALEVGMQNSGLATALAVQFFSALSALPGAIFSVWLNLTGSLFAAGCSMWDKRTTRSRKSPS